MARVVRPGDGEHRGVTHWLGRPGNVPRGRLTLISGMDGTGKTTLLCSVGARRTRGLPIFEPVAGDPLYDIPPAARLTTPPPPPPPPNFTPVNRGGRDIVRRRTTAPSRRQSGGR